MARAIASSQGAASPWMQRPWVRWGALLVLLAVLVVAPLQMSEFTNQTLARIGVFAVAVLGLNVVMGYTGQVSLGQIFFLGLGAYVTAYGVTQGWNIVVVFVLACLASAVAGLLVALAAARLGGLAIAMVTVALPIVGVPLAKRLSDFTGGSEGLSTAFAAAPSGSGLYDDQWQLYLVLIIGVLENLAAVYIDFIGFDLKVAVPFVLIFVVLIVRPQGLFGRKSVVRV